MNFSRWLFRIAGIYGLIVLVPQYFLETKIGEQNPPAVTHPEFFYGFLGVAIAWQIAFLIISQDPIRFRTMIIPSVVEKFSFGIAAIVLFAQQRLPGMILAAGMVDLILGVLFLGCVAAIGCSIIPLR
ncbi:MAG TPA: hypothetical protein VGJ04_12530 [Pirellulales bacterium]